jgi:transposase-like protein
LKSKRDAAKDFFKKAIKHNGRPTKVTVDKTGINKAALDFCNLGVSEKEYIMIREIKYLNNLT